MKNKAYKTQSLILTLIVLGFVLVLNYLANKKFIRVDLTEDRIYSISSASKKLLNDLDDIVNIKVYFSRNLPPHLKKLEGDVRDLLTEFGAYAGGNLRISWEDPSRDEETKRKVRALGIPEVQMQSYEKDKAQVINGFLGVAVLYADKKEVLPVIQNVENLEYDLAQAVMKVFRSEPPKIGVMKTDTTAWLPEQMRRRMQLADPTEEKYRPIFEQLRQNYEVELVDISEGKAIDETLKTLIVPGGGDAGFTERDLFEIDQYFMKGGNLIVLADALSISMQQGVSAAPQSPRILSLLEHYGVRVEKNAVLDASCGSVQIPQRIGAFQMNVAVNYPYFVKITGHGFNRNNPAVSGLGQMIFPWASSLTILVDEADSTGEAADTAVTASLLVQSSSRSWVSPAAGHLNLNPHQDWNKVIAEKQGELKPRALVVYLTGNFPSYFAGKSIPPVKVPSESPDDAMSQIQISAEDQDRKIIPSNSGRHLVVAADSDFLTAQNATPGNIAWLLNVADWLTLDENLISIRSRSLVDRTIQNDHLKEGGTSFASMIRFVNILVMPILAIALGLIIFFRRREVIVAPAPSGTSADKKEDSA